MPISRTLPRLAAVLLVSLLGCTSQPTGSVQLSASVSQALSASSVARVRVTVSASSMTSLSVDLSKANGAWGGTLGGIPAGSERSVLAEAFDASGVLRFQGQALHVPITANQTAPVALTLQDLEPVLAYGNGAPFIDSMQASTSVVQKGGTLSVASAAHDPNAGDTLTWAWTASGGSFSAPAAVAGSWTAPATPGVQTLTLTVTDAQGLSATLSLAVNVVAQLENGGAAMNLSMNSWPVVSKVSATRNPVDAGQSTTVTATATDADGDGLSYQWVSTCTGTWTNATSSTGSFVPTVIPPGACNNCQLTVTVQDGRGGQATGSASLCVAAASIQRFPAYFTQASQASSGQTVVFDVTAVDPQGASLTFAWTANTGTPGTAQNTASTSHMVWTPPATRTVTPTITVTVTNAHGLSVSKLFEVKDPCAGVVCSTPPGQCYAAAGTCSNGACSYTYKASGVSCNDGDACTLGDTCNGAGGCSGNDLSCNSPPGPCYVAAGTCSSGSCGYAPKASGLDCPSDNNICTADVCNDAGTCSHPPVATGTPCGTSTGAWGSCGGFTDFCDTTGIQSRAVTALTCGAGVCGASSSTTETQACTRGDPDKRCAAPSYGPWGTCNFSDACVETGTQSRTVTNYAYDCAIGQCKGTPGTESQSCTRNTTGMACASSSYGGWSSCSGFSGVCGEMGSQSRSETSYACYSGICRASTTTATQTCTRPTPTITCGTSYNGCGTCSGFSGVCGESGTQSCSVTNYTCSGGSCSNPSSTSSYSQSCTRSTTGTPCGSSSASCGACTGFSGVCGESGTQSCSVTNYTCSGGSCSNPSSTSSYPQSCARDTDGQTCGSALSCDPCVFNDYCSTQGISVCRSSTIECASGSCSMYWTSFYGQNCSRPAPSQSCPAPSPSYGAWSACSSSGECGASGTQSRTVTTYSSSFDCATGQCVNSTGSTYTETQACTAPPIPPNMNCGGVCVDTSSDPRNCGACGRRCPFKFPYCEAGSCNDF